MTSILDTLQQQLGPTVIQQMSQSLGADPKSTATAVSMALPALLGGLSHNASRPDGAAALDRALADHDGSVLDNLGGILGGGAASGIGGAILGHIFGAKRGSVEQGVGAHSGLNAQQVSQLLMMLAPIVMGVLGRAKQQNSLNPAQLPQVLQQSAQQAQGPGGLGSLAGMFDANHDGSIADDMLKAGTSVLGNMFGKKGG